VDRALDPDLLRIALGDAVGLPTTEDLMEQLASTEVALFRGEQRVSDELQATAWYLHSVGSALPALDLYGPERQRSAFQVAGHVFDLALNDSRFAEAERLRFTFAAQVANIRGGLNPNALAAYRWRLGSSDLPAALCCRSPLRLERR